MDELNINNHPTPNIRLGTDGKYHWYHEFRMLKDPTILFLLWKIFFWICVGIWVFLLLLDAFDGNFLRGFWKTTKMFAIFTLAFEAFVAFGYFLYAAFLGFKYCVMFEMDDRGLMHIQMPSQFRKAQAAAFITVIAGLATERPGTVGTGVLAGSKSSMYSSWKSVRSIEIFRSRGVIKVNETFNKNQVYALPEDFEWVMQYVKSHVPSKCKISEK
ncbi:MAG: hypothetical protein SOZ80_06705 [Prevotella sp.]|uniref:hypothetical protein n=1 Tax=Prevotella sp. TaxID=59823 RepID=UPI002A33C919|nr:hypothetical protein [Prevotella sp.]MDD7317711.1 hypothetical protein [Prevotellaceae bacterium]MDY4020443.1 hypothetical protein [Prevotella sp.]